MRTILRLALGALCLAAARAAGAATGGAEPTIQLTERVHFAAPDGGDLVVEPGLYQVEPVEDLALRLSREATEGEAVLVQARPSEHEESLERTIAILVTPQEGERRLVLLSPSGVAMEAVGYVGEVRPRAAAVAPLRSVQIRPLVLSQVPPPQPPATGQPQAGLRPDPERMTLPSMPKLALAPGTPPEQALSQRRRLAGRPEPPDPARGSLPQAAPKLQAQHLQPPVGQEEAVRQVAPLRVVLPTERHVFMRAKLVNDELVVVESVIVDEPLLDSDATVGNHVLAVRRGGVPISVSSVDDPFTMHSFVDPSGKGPQYHEVIPNPDAVIEVRMPLAPEGLQRRALTLEDLNQLDLELDKLDVDELPTRMNLDVFRILGQQRRLKPVARIGALKLAPTLRQTFERANLR
jgi:hypothetical protein